MHGLQWFWNNYIYTFGPSRGKTFLRSFRPDYCNYQPAQPQRLARILKFRLSANDEGEDQTTQTDLCRCFTQPQRQFLARLLKKLYFYCYSITDRNSFANKLVPNQSVPRGALWPGTFCLHHFFSIFLTGRFHIIKNSQATFLSLFLTLQMWRIFLVASLDTWNVEHFSCCFSWHLKCKSFSYRYILVKTSYKFVSWHFSWRFKCGAIFLSLLLTLQMWDILLAASHDTSNRTQFTRSM